MVFDLDLHGLTRISTEEISYYLGVRKLTEYFRNKMRNLIDGESKYYKQTKIATLLLSRKYLKTQFSLTIFAFNITQQDMGPYLWGRVRAL